ncbi:MAG: phosphoribosylglycinamide formyltransferase [Oscillospiraceae bacterium]|nr:phosphoribosylglycinamide formyltransferase [Oscillospiraceae bacterium]
MLKVSVLVSGGGTNLQAIIDRVADGKITNTEIVKVISNKKGAYALERAQKRNIPALALSKKDFGDSDEWENRLIEELDGAGTDLIVLAGFLAILSEKFTKHYENRIINIHPSLIPSFCGAGYYGLKVHEEALKKGVKVTGATVHYVNEGIDSGKIISQKAVYVQDGDTPETLQRRVMEQAEWILLPQAIDDIANNRI